MKSPSIVLVWCLLDIVMGDVCPNGMFWWPQGGICHSWLNCEDMTDLKVGELVGSGAVKAIFKAEWREYVLAYVELLNDEFEADFLHGLRILKSLQISDLVVKLRGVCESKMVYLTEYHELGDARNIPRVLKDSERAFDRPEFRLGLCATYTRILAQLHENRMVMCDSNNLEKTLSQFLIRKADLKLLVNDLDSVAGMRENEDKSVIRCGPNILEGEFLAPEQRGERGLKLGYDEKTDIWKLPAVCGYFLGKELSSLRAVLPRLGKLHRSCKNEEPNLRPNAKQVAEEYDYIIWTLLHNEEL